jgi:Phosphomethylpyrimidine kinase
MLDRVLQMGSALRGFYTRIPTACRSSSFNRRNRINLRSAFAAGPTADIMKVAWTIAGSDSSGGAGIQADLKTFTAFGVYGASVITALTAQNTVNVRSVADLLPGFVAAQIHAVMHDLPVAGVSSEGPQMKWNRSMILCC